MSSIPVYICLNLKTYLKQIAEWSKGLTNNCYLTFCTYKISLRQQCVCKKEKKV